MKPAIEDRWITVDTPECKLEICLLNDGGLCSQKLNNIKPNSLACDCLELADFAVRDDLSRVS